MKKQQLILTSCAACSGAATISHNIPCPLQVQVMTWTTTQSFQLGGHRAHQKIWLIFGHSVKQPGDLGTGAKCQPWHGQRCCQFWCFCDFSLPNYGQAGIRLTIWPWPLTSQRMSVMRVIVLHPCTKFEVHRSPLRNIWCIFHLSINQPRDLDLWPSDL